MRIISCRFLAALLLLLAASVLLYSEFRSGVRVFEPSTKNVTLGTVRSRPPQLPGNATLWDKLELLPGNDVLYPETLDVDEVLHALRTAKIVHADLAAYETSYKYALTLEGGQRALFKPLIVPKNQRFPHCFKCGCEHGQNEIVAFHLNRILGLRNMPFTTGRTLSWWDEILPVATERLKMGFYRQNKYIARDYNFPVLIWIDSLQRKEVSRRLRVTPILFPKRPYSWGYKLLPQTKNRQILEYDDHRHYDYKPAYKPRNITRELDRLPGDDTYCKVFRKKELYREDTWFADVTDISVLDFLMSHTDSMHAYINGSDDKPAFNVMIDFGRAFCDYPEKLRFIAPIIQCCKVRKRVYENLVKHRHDLIDVFTEMTKDDPLFPLLAQDQLDFVRERQGQLLSLIDYCILEVGPTNVLMDI